MQPRLGTSPTRHNTTAASVSSWPTRGASASPTPFVSATTPYQYTPSLPPTGSSTQRLTSPTPWQASRKLPQTNWMPSKPYARYSLAKSLPPNRALLPREPSCTQPSPHIQIPMHPFFLRSPYEFPPHLRTPRQSLPSVWAVGTRTTTPTPSHYVTHPEAMPCCPVDTSLISGWRTSSTASSPNPKCPPHPPKNNHKGVRICRPTTHSTPDPPVLLHQTLCWDSH